MARTKFWPEFGGLFLIPSQAPGIQTWSQSPELPGFGQGVLRKLRSGMSPSSQRVTSGKAFSRQSLPHQLEGSPSRSTVQVFGTEFGWLTALVMGLLEIRTCLQPLPSGPGPNHTVTCTDSVLKRISCLPGYPTIHSLHWGLWPAFPQGGRASWSPDTGHRLADPSPCPSAVPLICLQPASLSLPLKAVVSCSIGVCWGFWWDNPDKLDLGAYTAVWSYDTSSWLHPLLVASYMVCCC